MEVIGFIHVSLGSRSACTCSEVGFSSQNGDRVCCVNYRRATFCFAFILWPRGLIVKDIHKEIFPVYSRKCLSPKAVHNWVEEFSRDRAKVADDAQ
jgi:hypothetical protein